MKSSLLIMDNKLDIPWHDKVWSQFSNARSRNHLPHALLISGVKGAGKDLFADRIVKSLLCIQPVDAKACNECSSCKTYSSEANPDYLELGLLEGKQQITVDQIRQLSQFLNYTRSFDGYRVVLVRSIEKMNINAANSLLKSLEEPTSNTVIILTADNLSRILPTIKSRCQKLLLPLPTRSEALTWLKKNSKNSQNNNFEELLKLSHGSPIIALEMPDKILQEKNDFSKDVFSILKQDKSIIEIAKKWEKYDLETLLDWQISWVTALIKKSAGEQEKNILINDLSEFVLSSSTQTRTWVLYQSLIKQKQYIHTSVNTLIFLENMIILWLYSVSATSH